MAVSTKWRVLSLANAGGQTGIAEVEMAATPGGANQCSGGTPSASGTYGGFYDPDKAFNGTLNNSGGEWFTPGGTGSWIAYEFPSAVTVTEIRIAPAPGDMNGTPRIMAFQYWDGAAWITDWYGFNTAWSVGVLVAFTKPDDASAWRYWAIQTANGAGRGSNPEAYRDTVITEVQMAESEFGPDVTGSGTAVGHPTNGSYPASQAFDGTGNIWYAGDGGKQSLLRYDFGAGNEKTIREIRLSAESDGNFNRAPGEGHILKSNDGRSFVSALDFSLTTSDYIYSRVRLIIESIPEFIPVLRGATSGNTNSNPVHATLPAGSEVGDSVYLFSYGAYGANYSTLNEWEKIAEAASGGGTPTYGGVYRKVLSAADIAAGEVTYSQFTGGQQGWALAVFDGPAIHRPEIAVAGGGVGDSSTMTLDSPSTVAGGDLCLIFGGVRNWSDVNSDHGTEVTAFGSSVGWTCELCQYAPSGPFTNTWTVLWGGTNFRAIVVFPNYGEPPEIPEGRRRAAIIVN
jgi:hypothetical protein